MAPLYCCAEKAERQSLSRHQNMRKKLPLGIFHHRRRVSYLVNTYVGISYGRNENLVVF